MKNKIHELKSFYILWSTQGLSQLGSAMTGFALALWLYQETGSALQMSLLTVCSYAPYVLMSIVAGSLSDRWDKKKTMLICDTLAACCTLTVLVLLASQALRPWHLYVLNTASGLMNTVQAPASEVAFTLIVPRDEYQRASGLNSFSQSLITILHPVFATSLYGLGGVGAVILVDLCTFSAAFLALLFLVRIPKTKGKTDGEQEPLLSAVKAGLGCLNENRLVLVLIFFLAGVNLVASAFDAALPAFVLPKENGGQQVLGVVTAFAGIAMLAGSLAASVLPAPKDRVRLIVVMMLFSLTTDNFLMSLTDDPVIWCAAQILGYLPVPLMNTSLDVIVRSTIPVEMQGRVYACRNSFQFFTIPIGYFLGGFLVDEVCEPFMAGAAPEGAAAFLFGQGKGSGAAMLIFLLGVSGFIICMVFGKLLRQYRYQERD